MFHNYGNCRLWGCITNYNIREDICDFLCTDILRDFCLCCEHDRVVISRVFLEIRIIQQKEILNNKIFTRKEYLKVPLNSNIKLFGVYT